MLDALEAHAGLEVVLKKQEEHLVLFTALKITTTIILVM